MNEKSNMGRWVKIRQKKKWTIDELFFWGFPFQIIHSIERKWPGLQTFFSLKIWWGIKCDLQQGPG